MSTQENISLEWEDMSAEQRVEHLSSALLDAQRTALSLGDALREARGRLESVLPVYERLYKKWWIRWFFAPWDPVLERRKLMRCTTCGGLFFFGGEKEFTSHRGHKYSVCREYGLREHIRLLAGRVE